MYTIEEVAEEFLTIDSMTQKKLQKLCYYAQGLYGAISGKKLFNDELEAWIHGPVSPVLYYKYKAYGYNNIPRRTSTTINSDLRDILIEIYRIYGGLDGDQLEALTHKEEPWKNARKGLKPYEPSNEIISFEDIKSFFKQKLLETTNG